MDSAIYEKLALQTYSYISGKALYLSLWRLGLYLKNGHYVPSAGLGDYVVLEGLIM